MGKTKIIDLEFLLNENNKRVAAFGRWAGEAGAFLGMIRWCHKQLNIPIEITNKYIEKIKEKAAAQRGIQNY